MSNPDADKYLCNNTSVNISEWVSNTCHSYLIKNKIPPCVILNGMKFPDKLDFFDRLK